MSDLTDAQARLAALKKARDSGVLTVKHGEEMVTYRSLSEIERIIAELEGEIAGLAGTSRRRVNYVFQSGKGL